MQKKVISFLLIVILSSYFLFFSHILVLDGPTSAISFGNSNNLITLAFVSGIIALGFWSVSARKEITINSSYKTLSLISILFIIPAAYHFITNSNDTFAPVIGALFFSLTFFAFYQLYKIVELKKLLLILIPVGAIIEMLLTHFNADICDSVSIVANHQTSIIWGITALLFITASDYETPKLKNLSTILSVFLAALVILELAICKSLVIICTTVIVTLISGICALKSKNNTFAGFILLLTTLLSGFIAFSTYDLYGSYNLSSYSTDIYAKVIRPNLLIGTGYETANSTILHYIVNNDVDVPFENDISSMTRIVIEAGIIGVLGIISAFLFLYHVYFKYSKKNAYTISNFCTIVPIIVLNTQTNIFDNSFIILFLLASYCWAFDSNYEERTMFYQTKSNFLVGQLAIIIPSLSITFVTTGIISLPYINKDINNSEITNEHRTLLLFNHMVRQTEYTEFNMVKTAENVYDLRIPALFQESIENLRDRERYSITPELYGILSKLEKIYSTNPNLTDENRSELLEQSKLHSKIQTFLEHK